MTRGQAVFFIKLSGGSRFRELIFYRDFLKQNMDIIFQKNVSHSVPQTTELVVIFGCAQDKNVDGMLRMLALGADKLLFTRSSENPRAIDPKELQRRFAEFSPKMTQVVPKLKEAINTAHKAIGRDDLICVTGSFYLAGEAKKLLQDARAKAEKRKAQR